jgi:hypothetical protein
MINCEKSIIYNSSDDQCSEGHVGGFCEQCDLYGTKFNSSYTRSSPFKCWKCEK